MTQTRPINQIIKDIYSRLDQYSLVVQNDRDEGDSAYRSAILSFLLFALKHPQHKEYYQVMIESLTASPGMFRRTANHLHWGYNPNNLSRDQASAILLAATVNGDNKTVEDFYNNAYSRKELVEVPKWGNWLQKVNSWVGFHQNIHPGTDTTDDYRQVPDLLGINEASNEIRRKKQWLKYPVLMLRDLSLIAGLYFRKKQTWDYDSLYAKDLIYANMIMPTIFSWIAKKLYAKTDYIERIKYNYADVNNGVEPLGELYELVCRKHINGEDN